MVEEFIPIFGILFGVGGPAVVVIVWFTLNYHKRRKLMELHHAERMAAIERGMEIPPLPIELIDGRSVPKRRRTALLPGLVWFFVGLAVVVGRARRPRRGHPGVPRADPARHRSRVSHLLLRRRAQRSKRAGWSTISRSARNDRPPGQLRRDCRAEARPTGRPTRPAVQLRTAGRVFGRTRKQSTGRTRHAFHPQSLEELRRRSGVARRFAGSAAAACSACSGRTAPASPR